MHRRFLSAAIAALFFFCLCFEALGEAVPEATVKPQAVLTTAPSWKREQERVAAAKRSCSEIGSYKYNYITASGIQLPRLYQSSYKESVCRINGKSRSVWSSGCSVTCLSMVIAYISEDLDQSPYTLMREAYETGVYRGNGLTPEAMVDLAANYGVATIWVAGSAESILNALNSGIPVIEHVRAGTFSSNGHYVLLRGIAEDGSIIVNDPGSWKNSQKTYKLSDLLRWGSGSSPFMMCL